MEHVRYCLSQTRVMVSHDEDFLALAGSGVHHAGLAFCKQGSRTLRQIIEFLFLMDTCLSSENMIDHVEFL